MKYIALTCQELEKIDFIPTIIIGFYQSKRKKNFIGTCIDIKKKFPDTDIIGCSSESNLYNKTPHLDNSGEHLCSFMCLDINKNSYDIKILPITETLDISISKDKEYGAVLLSSTHFSKLEETINKLQTTLGKNCFYGAIASVVDPGKEKAEVYCNGLFYSHHLLVWLIDQAHYTLRGMSAHHFQPVGFPLVVTESSKDEIYKIENKPALDVIEEILGTITQDTIDSFDHPFFLRTRDHMHYNEAPLCSLKSINRKNKSITMFRYIPKSSKLKIGISLDTNSKLAQLKNFHQFDQAGSVALLFNCVGIKGNLQFMETLYLMDLKRNLKIPFVGFHSFGEIGPTNKENYSVLHNQTVSLAVISEKEP